MTDGKLAVYVHDLTVKQVISGHLYCCDNEFGDAVECDTIFPCVFLQADKAREYGARVYCVGVKDFDKDQVNEALFVLLLV